jgi:hypothetical protein
MDLPKQHDWRRLLRHPLAWVAAAGAVAGPLILFFVYGCGARPRAPALIDEPVYQNQQEGFRFFTPDGWRIQGRSEFHSGTRLDKERMLVEYRRVKQGPFASLMVSMIDLPETQSVAEYVETRVVAKTSFRPAGVERLTLANQPAERFSFSGKGEGGVDMTREIVALRRGQRVYFFTAIYSSKDATARDAIRKAVASLSW